MGRLRHRKGAPDDTYDVTGSLDGIRPGDRNVGYLTVRRLTGETREGLRPLTAFEHLEALEIVGASGIDLAPLAEVNMTRLQLSSLERVDLGPLAQLGPLRNLGIADLRDCQLPERLPLPATLQALFLGNDTPPDAGTPVKALIDAVDWSRLHDLRSLDIRVGGARSNDTITVKTEFVKPLTRLERLRLVPGVWVDPPFDDLPATLTSISIDAWQPETVRDMLRRRLPGANVIVHQRYAAPPGAVEPWEIVPPDPDDDPPEWSAYGSLADAADDPDIDTEYEALQAAKRRLRAADPALLARLEFDHESAGTAILARTREDLERALELLAVR